MIQLIFTMLALTLSNFSLVAQHANCESPFSSVFHLVARKCKAFMSSITPLSLSSSLDVKLSPFATRRSTHKIEYNSHRTSRKRSKKQRVSAPFSAENAVFTTLYSVNFFEPTRESATILISHFSPFLSLSLLHSISCCFAVIY